MLAISRYSRLAVLVVACLMAQTLGTATAEAQEGSGDVVSLHDIAVRNELIFDQEALLNAYRCRFNIDTHIVPGGCSGGLPVEEVPPPGVFPGVPTQHEVDVRDALIFAQELLLNAYRCRFNIDTHVVPGGCPEQLDGTIGADVSSDDAAPAPAGFDTWDRDAVLAAYAAEFTREEPESGYFGDVFACDAGTTSRQFRDSVVQRVNWYRQMAGLRPVSENREFSAAAQQAALIMAAQERISHYPRSDWACYTQTGADAARSNLSLGAHGIEAIDNYMQDDGDNNLSVGHRRWILYARLTVIGTGDIPPGANRAANALYVFGQPRADTRQVREERGFVAWPPPGYVPAEVAWERWSFVLPNADFSGASVEVSDEHGPVEVQVIDRDRFIETGIVWAMGGESDSGLLPDPSAGDHCYAVKISGVVVNGAVEAPFEYAVCVLGA